MSKFFKLYVRRQLYMEVVIEANSKNEAQRLLGRDIINRTGRYDLRWIGNHEDFVTLICEIDKDGKAIPD